MSVAYSISGSYTNTVADDYVNLLSEVMLDLYNSSTSPRASDIESIDYVANGIGSDSNTISGILSVTQYYTNGQSGEFEIDTYDTITVGAVPEPSAILLIGAGIAGLAGLRRIIMVR